MPVSYDLPLDTQVQAHVAMDWLRGALHLGLQFSVFHLRVAVDGVHWMTTALATHYCTALQ